MDYLYAYADSLGNIVVKLRFDEVAANVGSTAASVELALVLKSGDVLIAEDIVSVKN